VSSLQLGACGLQLFSFFNFLAKLGDAISVNQPNLTRYPMAWENNHPTLPHRIPAQVYLNQYSIANPTIPKLGYNHKLSTIILTIYAQIFFSI